MNASSRQAERQAALRFAVLTAGWLACVFLWTSLATFDPADTPGSSVWPPPAEPLNWCGSVGAFFAHHAFTALGWGAFTVLAVASVGLLAATRGAPTSDLWLRFIGLLLIGASSAATSELLLGPGPRDTPFGPGGFVGLAAGPLLLHYLQPAGAWLCLSFMLIVGCVLAADVIVISSVRGLAWASRRSGTAVVRGGAAMAGAGAAVATGVGQLAARVAAPRPSGRESENGAAVVAARRPASRGAAPARPTRPPPAPADDADDESYEQFTDDELDADEPSDDADDHEHAEDEAPEDEAPATPPPPRRSPPAAPAPRTRAAAPPKPAAPLRRQNDSDYLLPPMNLLEEAAPPDRAAIEQSCREKALVLEQTLNEFRLEVEVVAVETGPVITVFELKLAPGIKISQIQSLSNDLARAMKAPAVRVVPTLPGKNTIGIEAPNIDKEKVRLRDIMETFGDRASSLAIPLYLGKDATGAPLVSDLTRMPHLLIAGTTGSGKSVCVGSIIMSVLLTRSPRDVQMVMIDPKVVELSLYKDVPHLICPIVTEMTKAAAILEWTSTKMDERYELLAEAGVKDIRSYNALGLAGLRERLAPESDEELSKIPVKLPYLVIIIDELADLMMMSPKETEFHLCRIAQKSRAVGIHLIVATQRPQANVVTGLIKANLPSRIAFRVASRLDSRIVLDQNGGEVLMGQGDMLFLPPGSAKLMRAQGTFVDDDELRAVVKHCRQQRGQEFLPELVRSPGAGGEDGAGRDELFDAAVDAIVASQRGSVSLLQRKFNIGYSRASRLVDQMYEAGIVGAYKGSQAREVLVTKEEWEAIRSRRDSEEEADD